MTERIYHVQIRENPEGEGWQYNSPYSLLWSDCGSDLNSAAEKILEEVNKNIKKANIERKGHRMPEFPYYNKVQFFQYDGLANLI